MCLRAREVVLRLPARTKRIGRLAHCRAERWRSFLVIAWITVLSFTSANQCLPNIGRMDHLRQKMNFNGETLALASDQEESDEGGGHETFDEIRIGCWDGDPDPKIGRNSSGSFAAAHGVLIAAHPLAVASAVTTRLEQAKQSGKDYETVFTNAKAGMDDVDKEYVKKVVFEMSKDSNFFKNEQRKGEESDKRIRALREKLHALTTAELENGEKQADRFMSEAEENQDLSRTFIHVDMDMFFAAVSQLHRPELANIPFAIGGLGMISTANYVARKYGVRSAMPGFIGKVLCEKPAPNSGLPATELTFVRSDGAMYSAVSKQVKQLLREFDPFLQSGGIDEAYLDVTDYMRRHLITGAQVAERIRQRIRETEFTFGEEETGMGQDGSEGEGHAISEGQSRGKADTGNGAELAGGSPRKTGVKERASGLTASCGVACNRRLAKICSDINKPDGQFVLASDRESVSTFISTLPIRKVGGIGRVTERTLKEVFGVELCGQIFEQRGAILRLMQPKSVEFLLGVAVGLGSSTAHEEVDKQGCARKGISQERTFRELSRPADLEAKLKEIADKLAKYMAQEELTGKTMTVKLKPVTFDTFTRATTLPLPIGSADHIFQAAVEVLRKEYPLTVRLMGIRMSTLFKRGMPLEGIPHDQRTVSEFFTTSTAAAEGGTATEKARRDAGMSKEHRGEGEGGEAGAGSVSATGSTLSSHNNDTRTVSSSRRPMKTQNRDIGSMFASVGQSSKSTASEEDKVTQLVEMGFEDREANLVALQEAGWRVEAAVSRLLQPSSSISSNAAKRKQYDGPVQTRIDQVWAGTPTAARGKGGEDTTAGRQGGGGQKRKGEQGPTIEAMLAKRRSPVRNRHESR